jgi:hypothetical protein
MVVDYLHKRKFPIIGPIATWTLRTATVGVLVGVYQFNTNDIGTISIYCCFSTSNMDSYRSDGVDCKGLDCITSPDCGVVMRNINIVVITKQEAFVSLET